jgi:Zn-dependent alcohol dehydrogenase
LEQRVREIQSGGTNANFDTTGVLDIIKAGVKTLHVGGQLTLIGIMIGQTLEVDLSDMLSVSYDC